MIMYTKEFGRGVFALQMYLPGDVIEVAEIIPFTPHDTEHILSTKLRLYTYRFNRIMDCLVLGNGCLYNHSDSPNVTYVIEQNSSGRPVMMYKALTHIKSGNQLFISYTEDCPDLDVSTYVRTYEKETN
jgi:tRNA-specific adenosine deaminase 3